MSPQLLERVQEALGRFVGDEGWCGADMDLFDELSAALASQDTVLVPICPSDAMKRAGRDARDGALQCRYDGIEGDPADVMLCVWRAMLAAAPNPSSMPQLQKAAEDERRAFLAEFKGGGTVGYRAWAWQGWQARASLAAPNPPAQEQQPRAEPSDEELVSFVRQRIENDEGVLTNDEKSHVEFAREVLKRFGGRS